MFTVTKTYGHELGLSACFRQWRADSHCSNLHGYALSFELEFECEFLDDNNWVIDFGGLKPVKKMLQEHFDHKLLVALDDPKIDDICLLQNDLGLADVLALPAVGCEAFAEYVFKWVSDWLQQNHPDFKPSEYMPGRIHNPRGLRLIRVTVREHGANAASYLAEGSK